MAEHAHKAGDHAEEVHHEPLPVRIYAGVLGSLLVLTAFTVWIAQFHFGEWNMMVAMAVAVTKASLVVLFFMNLRYDHDHLNRVIFIAALLFLGIYLTGTFSDVFTRGDVDPWRGQPAQLKDVGPHAAPHAAGGAEHH